MQQRRSLEPDTGLFQVPPPAAFLSDLLVFWAMWDGGGCFGRWRLQAARETDDKSGKRIDSRRRRAYQAVGTGEPEIGASFFGRRAHGDCQPPPFSRCSRTGMGARQARSVSYFRG